MNPFKIDSPTCISFSGGRTSAYMLWRVLDANQGLPAEAKVCFANTGKEEEATLEFVRDCEKNWNVPITWLEYQTEEPGFRIVSFETASRNGEPFEALIKKRGFLPNPVSRFCTRELKIRVIGKYIHGLGMSETKSEAENMCWIGIRKDEPRRAAKIEDKSRIPLYTDGISKQDVGEFWAKSSFDLGLPNNNGVTMHGNCDLCFLKGAKQVLSLIQENPSRAVWWARMEEVVGAGGNTSGDGGRFRKDRAGYAEMMEYSKKQIDMFDSAEEAIPCFCGE